MGKEKSVAAKPLAASANPGISIRCVRIKNFRCLHELEVVLTPTTILIGENNAGKTSFLDAIHAAIGSGQRNLGEDDIYLAENEIKPPRDRDIAVDILILPVDADGKQLSAFPESSPWLELWGNGISQDENDDDFLAMRLTMSWDQIKGDYYVQRRFLKEWKQNLSDMLDAELSHQISQVSAAQIAPIALYFLDAKRDASEEMKTRGSTWNRLVSHHGLEDNDIDTIERQLSEINELLVTKSGVLSHVQEHLHSVSDVVNCSEDDICVNPVARKLRDLNRGMDVVLATKGAPQFPLSRHGMGTRSLTSVLLFRAYMTWRQKQQTSEALHPFVAIEEPEAHLHPQAQRSLFKLLCELPGQRIISTHSPYVCSQANITDFVHFSKQGNNSKATRFYSPGSSELSPEDIRAINRRVLNTRGDLLFSRCVVLFEGETEEQALPQFAEHYWGKHPNDLGISFISVDGYGNYLPFLRLTLNFEIPWVIFSDGEPKAIQALDNALSKAGQPASSANPRCIVLPNDSAFERYLVETKTLSCIQRMIADYKIECGSVTDDRGVKGIRKCWSTKSIDDVVAELETNKTAYGARIANSFREGGLETPECIRKALDIAIPIKTTIVKGSA